MNIEIFTEIGHSEQMEGQATEQSTHLMPFPGLSSQLELLFHPWMYSQDSLEAHPLTSLTRHGGGGLEQRKN